MTGERILRIRVRTVGQESVQRSVRGITQSARTAARTQQQADQQTTREAQRNARSRERAVIQENRARQRLVAQTARAEAAAEREMARAASATNRQQMREWNEAFRARQRMRQREQQEQTRQARRAQQQRTASGRRDTLVAGGLATAGVAAAIRVATTSLDAITTRLETITAAVGSRAGVQDVGARTATAQDFELNLARASGEFFQGVDPEERARQMAALTDEINHVAVAAGQSPTELLDVLNTMQQQFSQFDVGRRDLQSIADEAQRTGADMQTLATFVGILNQQLGETAPTAERAFDIMAQGGLQGAITPESFAEEWGGSLGQFSSRTGLQGEDALRQLSALANVIRPGARSDAEAATQTRAFLDSLGDVHTRERIREATGGRQVGTGSRRHWEGGTQAFRADGTVDVMQLIADLAPVQGIGSTNSVFHRTEALQAVSSLTRAQRGEGTAPSVADLVGVDAATASARRAEDLARVHGTSAFESKQIAVQGQVEGIQQLEARAREANDMLNTNEAVTQLNGEGLMAQLGQLPVIGTWLQQHAGQAADAVAGLSPEHRAALANPLTRTIAGGLLPFGNELVGGVNDLGAIGDRRGELASERAAARVQIQDGARVVLDPESARLVGSEVASALPTPPGGPAAAPPADLRVPRGRRP